MTVTSDALSRGLVYQLVAATSPDGEHSLSLGLLHTIFLGLLLLRRLLLGETRTLLAPLVLALQAHFVGAVKGSAAVAAAMDTHTDRFLDTLDGGLWSWCSDPLVRLKSEAVLGEQGAGSFLLHGVAIHLLSNGS